MKKIILTAEGWNEFSKNKLTRILLDYNKDLDFLLKPENVHNWEKSKLISMLIFINENYENLI
jgi:hypothetical protein